MAANQNPIFGLTPNVSGVTVLPGDTTTKKTVWTAGANGGYLSGVSVTSDDTADRNLNVYITIGGTDYLVGQILIPLASGTSTTPAVNLLSLGLLPWLQPDGSWIFPASAILKVAAAVTITAAKTITIVGHGMDY